jgi:hypothetical protein
LIENKSSRQGKKRGKRKHRATGYTKALLIDRLSMMTLSSVSNTPPQPQRRILQHRSHKRVHSKTEREAHHHDCYQSATTAIYHYGPGLTQWICLYRQTLDPVSYPLGCCMGCMFFSGCCLEKLRCRVDRAKWCCFHHS